MKISDANLKTDLQNANEGTQRGRGLLEKSLRQLGAGRSILVDKSGNVIAGNKTLEGAAELDLPVRIIETDGKELVVVKRTDLDLYSESDKRARTMAYADNKIAELDLAWRPEQIEVDFQPLELEGWGFNDGVPPVNYDEEWQGMPEFEQEDLRPIRQIIVSFKTIKYVNDFMDVIGQKFTEKAKSIWYPKNEILHQSLVIENDQP